MLFMVGQTGKTRKWVYGPSVSRLIQCVCVCVWPSVLEEVRGAAASGGTSTAFFIHRPKKRLHHRVTLATPADHRAHPSICLPHPLPASGHISEKTNNPVNTGCLLSIKSLTRFGLRSHAFAAERRHQVATLCNQSNKVAAGQINSFPCTLSWQVRYVHTPATLAHTDGNET